MTYIPYGGEFDAPKRKRNTDPTISIYLINERSPEMEKLSCIWCKRTVADIKGRVDKIVDAPINSADFGIAVNIRCKLCHQNYRLVMAQTFISVIV